MELKNRQRQSNMELLRIVSMLMVLGVHVDGASLGLPVVAGDISLLDARSIWQLSVESMCIIGVNCFTLISGYFGIKLSMRGALSFLFQCAIYAVGIYTAVAIAFPAQFSLIGWVERWMVLSHTDLWYVPAYFGLMLVSPFINNGLDRLPVRRFGAVLAVFILFNLWCGWWWGGNFNPTGYTLVQLIMMYITGRYIRRIRPMLIVDVKRKYCPLACYVIATVMVFLSALWLDPLKAFAYNSPFVMLASVAMLVVFMNVNIQSAMVNRVAMSSFAVYLIHKDPLVWGNIMRPAVIRMWNGLSLATFSLAAVGVVLAFFVVAMLIDPVRRRIFGALELFRVHRNI